MLVDVNSLAGDQVENDDVIWMVENKDVREQFKRWLTESRVRHTSLLSGLGRLGWEINFRKSRHRNFEFQDRGVRQVVC